ncbi:DUF998 domain-containing protein [Gordonia sp. (in: high G+C Gram-positive bacteria)]|uniref:DUF998 domain-containing protein n=1 Tax=Gordonia sp. (in: high G+C Gram-positive bacteria) TaxID=84139 RepID=UPI0039E52382
MASKTPQLPTTSRPLAWTPLGAVIGPLVFTGTFFVLAASWPGYSPVRQQISVLAAAPGGIALDIAFVVAATLMFVGLLGLSRTLLADLSPGIRVAVTVLLSIPLLGMVICGAFPFDSSASFMHIIGANIACSFPVIGFAVSGILLWKTPDHRRLGVALVFASILTALALAAYLTSAPLEDIRTVAGGGTLGRWERILVMEIFAWYVVLGLAAFAHRRATD